MSEKKRKKNIYRQSRNKEKKEASCPTNIIQSKRSLYILLTLISCALATSASPAKAGLASEIVELIVKIGGHLVIRIGTRNPELAPYIWTAIGTLVTVAIIYWLLKAIKKWEKDRELSSRIYVNDTSNRSERVRKGKLELFSGLLILSGMTGYLYWKDLAPEHAANKPSPSNGREWRDRDPDTGKKTKRVEKSQDPFPIKTFDAAIAMKSRVSFFPSDNQTALNTTDYKKVTGDLARIQYKLLIQRSRAKELPEVLIGQGAWNNKLCNQHLPSLGIYQYGGTNCNQLITVNFTDGNNFYEHQIEVIITLAHEWGHHLINLSGEKISGINNELLSDCFAGVYLAYLHKYNALSEQEFNNGVKMMTQIGDTHGTSIHGTKYQRANGLISGYGYAHNRHDKKNAINWNSFCKGLENIIDLSKGLP